MPVVYSPMRVRNIMLCLFAVLAAFATTSATAAETVTVGLYQNPPKVFRSESGQPSGFFVDILEAIAKQEAWQLQYVDCAWENCLQQLERGDIDLMPDVAYSTERDRRFDFHREVVLSNWTLIYAAKPRNYRSILNLDGVRVAVIAGSIQYAALQKRSREFDIHPVYVELDSSEAALVAVASGQADSALVNRLYGLKQAGRYGLKPTHILVESSHLFFAAPQGRNAHLLAAIDRRLNQMKQQQGSSYFAALGQWVEPLEQESMPVWLIWAVEGLLLLVLLLLITSITLRHLVKRKTAELLQQTEALQHSEKMFRTLFENSRDAMMFSTGEDLVDCNQAMLTMFRYPSVDAMRRLRRDDLFPPYQEEGDKSSPSADEKIRQAFEEGPSQFEWIHRRADGSTFPSEVTLLPMTLDGKKMIQATIRDISERKQNELSLRQLNRALQTLSHVNHTLIHSRDEQSLLKEVCRTIVEDGGYRLAWVGVAQYDERRSVRPVAQYGFDSDYLDSLRISWQNDEFGNGPTGIAIRTGKPSLVRDIHNDPRYEPWREQALKQHYASSIALPLTVDNTTFGAINIYSGYADAFGENELVLLKELAEDVAFGIHTQRMKLDHTEIKEEREGHKRRLQDALLQTIQAITVMVEKRDPFTAGHQRRVADLAVAIGRELEIDDVRLEGLNFGAMIHDIGNIYVPAEILNRPGKLSESELKIVQSHPSVGYDIVKGIDFPWPVADMILHHQERLDGSGYPDGLKGEAISLEARIIGVADVVEAMLSHRPYRSSFSVNEALEEIEKNRDIKYDASVVDACINIFRSKGYSFPV